MMEMTSAVARSAHLTAVSGTISSLRQRHQAVEETLWHGGLAAAADGAFVIGSDGRISRWNAAAERIMGYGAADVVGRHCCDVFESGDSHAERIGPRSCQVVALMRSGEQPESFDLQTRTKGGRPIWLNVSTVVFPGTTSGGFWALRTFRDVTPVKDMLALIRGRLTGAPAKEDPAARLTRREAEVLRLMASGATNRMLATELCVSPATVRNHAHNIFEKLGVRTRVGAIMCAMTHAMI
jgi:PAS domain S-box-containing protein